MSDRADEKGYAIIGADKLASAHPEIALQLKTAADMLGEAYGIDVSVRLNGDRTSGGAWLVTDPESPLEVDMGIIVKWNSVRQIREDAETGFLEITAEERFAEDGVDPAALAANGYDGYLTYHAHVGLRSIRVLSLGDGAVKDPFQYVRVRCPSIGEALEFVRECAVVPVPASGLAPR